jgi:hypothetical protein
MNEYILTNNNVRTDIFNNNNDINNDINNNTNIHYQNNQNQNNDKEYISTKYSQSRSLQGSSRIEKDLIPKNNIFNNKNIKISRVNIDSSYRNIEAKNILDYNISYLDNNPIDIINIDINNTDIVIHQKKHGLNINDNIVIQGVKSKIISLDSGISFINNSSYAKINHPNHGINFNTINNMYIVISNFNGNFNNNTDYNNIPINVINGLQQIFPVISNLEIPNDNYYYINMNSIISNFTGTYNLSSINIVFKDINGINLNLINANYPTSYDQIYGFQTIYYVEQDLYKIKLNIQNNINILKCGGNSIWIAKINDFIDGYINNNYYKITLKKTFYNVSRIKLISTEFPNTEKIIKSIPSNKKNNMFYWKILSDGDTIYSISIPPGNYSPSLLQTTMQNLINNVPRYTLTILNLNLNNTIYSYSINNNCQITISPDIDFFSIQFYSTIFSPSAILYKSSSNYTDNIGRLIINHLNHRLQAGLTITISNAIATDGIPQDVLNNKFIIETIIDENTYQLKLPKYNISASNNNTTNGGLNMAIIFPIKAQLLFTTFDTIGNLIGFRNVGNLNSVTNFNYITNNTDLYIYDNINTNNNYTNNSINLSGNNYILMSSPIFKESYNTGNVDNVFAKLLLASEPGTVMYNQFIQLGETFTNPLKNFSEWEVYFYDINGDLYNFGNLEHSYTLEIYEDINN